MVYVLARLKLLARWISSVERRAAEGEGDTISYAYRRAHADAEPSAHIAAFTQIFIQKFSRQHLALPVSPPRPNMCHRHLFITGQNETQNQIKRKDLLFIILSKRRNSSHDTANIDWRAFFTRDLWENYFAHFFPSTKRSICLTGIGCTMPPIRYFEQKENCCIRLDPCALRICGVTRHNHSMPSTPFPYEHTHQMPRIYLIKVHRCIRVGVGVSVAIPPHDTTHRNWTLP